MSIHVVDHLYDGVWSARMEVNICRLVVYNIIYVLLLEFQGEVVDLITNGNHVILLCLCQGRNMISNTIWRDLTNRPSNEISAS